MIVFLFSISGWLRVTERARKLNIFFTRFLVLLHLGCGEPLFLFCWYLGEGYRVRSFGSGWEGGGVYGLLVGWYLVL